jgi:hypothetical protein
MQNNWVLLQGRLCHTPNYSATKRGLHKVAFRLAIPRAARTSGGAPLPPTSENPASALLPALSPDSDYVTVIIIGAPAWEFKQLELKAGAPVRVQGRLRSWDVSTDQRKTPADPEEPGELTPAPEGMHNSHRDHRLEVIAEKVDFLDGAPK